jgi:hypothetical protein
MKIIMRSKYHCGYLMFIEIPREFNYGDKNIIKYKNSIQQIRTYIYNNNNNNIYCYFKNCSIIFLSVLFFIT